VIGSVGWKAEEGRKGTSDGATSDDRRLGRRRGFAGYVKFESFDKPFNSGSMYKLSDLEIISKKLGLEGGIKRKKSEIYKLINVAVA
jgi:hypothetical protein